MARGKVVKVLCHYRDASLLEGLIGTFRKLLVDVDWICGRMVDGSGTYEVYVGVRDCRNLLNAVLDLSTTVNVDRVEVIDNVDFDNYMSSEKGGVIETFKIYIPKESKVDCYSWGETCG